MNILITGASGLIGRAVAQHLMARGDRVIRLSRAASGTGGPHWNPAAGEVNLGGVGPVDGVVHLAGETIGQRWSAAAKIRIRESRVNGTRLLCEALAKLPQPPKVLIAASATGIYGDRGDEILDEQSPSGRGFLAEICREWEAVAATAREHGTRVVPMRFGIVLAPNGGALAKMLPAFRLGLGGKLGRGRHYWSWIAVEDAVRAIEHALVNESLRDPVNAVSPNPVTNLEFTKTLGTVLRRPTFLTVPAFAVKLLFGEMGEEALLASFRVQPRRLVESGFVLSGLNWSRRCGNA